jgi:hypothetical protein
MRKSWFSEEQIFGRWKEAEAVVVGSPENEQ